MRSYGLFAHFTGRNASSALSCLVLLSATALGYSITMHAITVLQSPCSLGKVDSVEGMNLLMGFSEDTEEELPLP